MKKVFFLLTICLQIAVLNSIFSQDPGVIRQPLSVRESGIWENLTITVCWENPSQSNAQQRTWVKEAIEDTWQKESGLRFIGWQTCATSAKGIRIRIADERPHVDALGRHLDGKKEGMTLNFTFNNWSKGCKDAIEECIKSVAVHEFGHAIGFAHEHNRPDCRCNDAPQGQDGDWFITPCDVKSVMNYCNDDWNNDGKLSEWDKVGVQVVYPKSKKEISVRNEGGFVARFILAYIYRGQNLSYVSDHITINKTKKLPIPGDARLINLSVEIYSTKWESVLTRQMANAENTCYEVSGTTVNPRIRNLYCDETLCNEVKVINSAAFNTEFSVSYTLDGESRQKVSGSFPVGQSEVIRIPCRASVIKVTARAVGGETIFSKDIASGANRCFKVHGTTLLPRYESCDVSSCNKQVTIRNSGAYNTEFWVKYVWLGEQMRKESGSFPVGQSKTIQVPCDAVDIEIKAKAVGGEYIFTKTFPNAIDRCYRVKGTTLMTRHESCD
jgi:hypothetical protein